MTELEILGEPAQKNKVKCKDCFHIRTVGGFRGLCRHPKKVREFPKEMTLQQLAKLKRWLDTPRYCRFFTPMAQTIFDGYLTEEVLEE